MTPSRHQERNNQIVETVKAGSTMAAVARRVGLSNQRVKDICDQAARLEQRMQQPREPWEELSTRAINCLRHYERDILKCEDITPEFVATLSPQELLCIPNFGPVSLREVGDWLERHGHPWPAILAPQKKCLQIALDKSADQMAAKIVALCGPKKSSEIARELSRAATGAP
jgi:hypothetical protein